MTRPHRPRTPFSSVAAAAAALLLAVAGLGGAARADEAAPGSARGAGPVTLFQQSLMQQQTPAHRDAFAQDRERRQRQQQAQLPLDRRDAVVRRTQSSLDELGFAPGPVDGKMGPQTRSAIRAFQRARDLRADGRVTQALLRDLATALADRRRVVAQQASGANPGRSDRRSADREAPGELRSERNSVELVDGPDSAAAEQAEARGARGGLIATAEAATPDAAAPLAAGEAEARATTARPGYMADGTYGLGDALAESWAIFTSVSGTMIDMLGARVARLAD